MTTTTTTTTMASTRSRRHRESRTGSRWVLGVGVSILIVVATATFGTASAEIKASEMNPPRQRFERSRVLSRPAASSYEDGDTLDAARLGKKKKFSVKKAVKSTKKVVSDTTSTVSDAVVDTATDAAKSVSKATATALVSSFDKSRGWSAGAVNTLADESVKLGEKVEDTAKMIVEFFKGFACNLKPSTMRSFISTFTQEMTNSGVADLVNSFKSDRSKWYNDLDGAVCQAAWTTVLGGPAQAAVAQAVKSMIDTLKRDCPAVDIAGTQLPVFTLGFAVTGDVHAAITAGVSMEIGLGVTLNGDQFCYCASCAFSGITIDSPGASGAAGIALTGYKDISSVPGFAKFLSVGVGVELPAPATIGLEGGLTFVFATDQKELKMSTFPDFSDSNFAGLSFFGGGNIGTPGGLPASVSYAAGACFTPVCVFITGSNCVSSAALGVAEYSRLGASSRFIKSPLATQLSIAALVAAAAVLAGFVAVSRRQSSKFADESTPLL
jgi:hypothetical protein